MSVEQRLQQLGAVDLLAALSARGAVVEVGDGVARVVGLQRVGYEELVVFDSGARGMAYDLAGQHTGVVLLDDTESVCAGEGVRATGRLPSLFVGEQLFGRVISPLGDPRDDRPRPVGGVEVQMFRPAPTLMQRAAVTVPLETGVTMIDAAIPIGRGQRQLIVGDRNVGKTALALDIVAAQRDTEIVCVYVVIGQGLSRALAIRDNLAEVGALARTVVVVAQAADAPGMQHLAPYAGTAIAEGFRDQGRDTLVVYDDLTKHADAYRELALLLGRAPGREAFPGDIFYVHAEMLERAAPLSPDAGGGTLTAIPLVETTESDISAYIPTNLISITDGQIYLDSVRFERNQRPAIDMRKSVSRIGGAAQPPEMRKAARNLRIDMTRFESLEALTRIGLEVDPKTQQTIARGRIMREILRQPRFTVRSRFAQIAVITAVAEGWLDGLAPTRAADLAWRAVEPGQAGEVVTIEAYQQALAQLRERES